MYLLQNLSLSYVVYYIHTGFEKKDKKGEIKKVLHYFDSLEFDLPDASIN